MALPASVCAVTSAWHLVGFPSTPRAPPSQHSRHEGGVYQWRASKKDPEDRLGGGRERPAHGS